MNGWMDGREKNVNDACEVFESGIQYNTVQCSAVQYSTVNFSTTRHESNDEDNY